MRRAAPGSLLLALGLALAALLAPAAARRLSGAELSAGSKPWQSKPVQNTKPLIGILAQVGRNRLSLSECNLRAAVLQDPGPENGGWRKDHGHDGELS